MPWKETSAMDQKMQLIGDYLRNSYSITQLSDIYEVSRNTVYKWIKRYKQVGNTALTEKDRAPFHHPNATSLEIARKVVSAKLHHPSWGPRKVIYWLKTRYPDRVWPAISTAGQILKRAGLVKVRKKRHHTPPYSEPFQECLEPNMVWSIDYKGRFKTRDGRFCYPLTVSDNYSRYLLGCDGLRHPSYIESKPILEALFKQYGLPVAIRTDNGTPFASTGLGALSLLSVWFIKLGIKPERIKLGHPEKNGRHERMHRSLKEAVANPPKENLKSQQKAFDIFRSEYNNERPHEALGMQTPATLFRPSLRAYPKRIRTIIYPGNYIVRKVRHNGEIKWKGEKVYVSQSLAGEPVALKQKENHLWELRYSTYPLGILDEMDMRIKPGEKVLTMSPV
jgi:putative transposase